MSRSTGRPYQADTAQLINYTWAKLAYCTLLHCLSPVICNTYGIPSKIQMHACICLHAGLHVPASGCYTYLFLQLLLQAANVVSLNSFRTLVYVIMQVIGSLCMNVAMLLLVMFGIMTMIMMYDMACLL